MMMKISFSLLAALAVSTTVAFTVTPALSSLRRHTACTALEAHRKPFISGNWKLNPQTKKEAIDLAKDIAAAVTEDSPDADVALFVPYVFIETAMEAVNGKINIGAEVGTIQYNTKERKQTIRYDTIRHHWGEWVLSLDSSILQYGPCPCLTLSYFVILCLIFFVGYLS
jgi:Triosephosphate isomerase